MERSTIHPPIGRWLPVLLLCALSACGGGSHRAVVGGSGGPTYAMPGPPEDPWGPYIRQASSRFDVPERWVRAVIRQETGGREYKNGRPITSDAGAMGLMQLMPATYGELAARFGLGSDPYEPHDNIMAGTGYIKELYERYGSPAFLAAYDAGPHRLDTYLQGRGSLPNETVNYLASAAPSLGAERPMTGPLAAFADTGGTPQSGSTLRAHEPRSASRCWHDPDAAYDPTAPCTAAPVEMARSASPVESGSRVENCWHDSDAAYDPSASCNAAQVQMAQAPLPAPVPWGRDAPLLSAVPPPVVFQREAVVAAPKQPERFGRNFLISSAAAATVRPAMASGRWAIQVGAFASPYLARRTAEGVRAMAPRELGTAQTVLSTTAPFGGRVLYRARLLGLSAETASVACGDLMARAQACVTVPPGG